MPPSNSGPMPDEMEAKAIEDVENLRRVIDGDMHVCPKAWDPYKALDRISAALRSARAEAFEEAAKVADRFRDAGLGRLERGRDSAAREIAAALREKAKL